MALVRIEGVERGGSQVEVQRQTGLISIID